jgi:hypothetical protein
MQPFSTTCAVICLNRPSIIPAAGEVIERAMALSGKARALTRSTLVIRPAALRSSSGLAAHSGMISKYISGGERPNRATSKPRVSQQTFEAANSTPGPRNSSHASRKSANLSTNGGRLYQQWLGTKIVPHKPQPCATMLAPPTTDQLPIHLVKEPLSFAESSDHTDVATASECLRLHFYRTNQQARSKEDLRKQLAASQAGTRALSWYLNSEHHKDIKPSHTYFLSTIVFGVVAEGSTSFLWEMINLRDYNERIDSSSDPGTYHLMSGGTKTLLLHHLIQAQAFWSTESSMFNEPLESFHTAHLDPELKTCVSRLYLWLVKCLTLADKAGIDVGSYDRFVENIPSYVIRDHQNDKDLDIGFLELVHPTHPDPRKLLRFFHDAVRDRQKMQRLESTPSERIKRLSIRLVHHCHRAGETTEARFVANKVEALLRRKSLSTATSRPVEG